MIFNFMFLSLIEPTVICWNRIKTVLTTQVSQDRRLKCKHVTGVLFISGIVHVSGNFWRDHRRFAMRTLKNFGMGRSILEDRIKQEVVLLIDTFRKSENEPFDPKVAVTTSVSNVICALSFGGHFKHGDPRFNELLHRLEENFNILGINGAFNFIPLLDKLPGDIFSKKKALANQDITYKFITKIIEEHMEDFDEDNITDYVSAYIKEMKIQQKTDPTTTFTGNVK